MYGDCCKSHLGSDGVFLRELNLSIKLNTIVAMLLLFLLYNQKR